MEFRMDFFSYLWSFTNYKISERFKYLFSSEEIIGKTSYGPVKGLKTSSSEFGYQYITFQGVPYAKPPIGDLRFKDPVPPDPWEQPPTDYANGGSMAWQKDMLLGRVAGNENCLHLNVFTKELEPETLRPVMVWIHGGAFVLGSNAKEIYNPELLLRKDIVLVTINYRLGAFGFLSLKDPELQVPGNAGLKDQTLALKWVKENISNFGGDPNNITLFGESAGGASVHYHMVSEMSAGLFHKAIAMSGSVFNPWALTPIKDWSERLAKALGWNGEGGDKAIYELLQKTSAHSIAKVQDKLLTLEDRKSYVLFQFGPTVEPYVGAQCFMPQDPKLLAHKCWSKNIPLLIGSCSDEGLLFYKLAMKKPTTLPKVKLEYMVPLFELGLDVDSEKAKQLGKLIKNYYFGYTDLKPETILVYIMILSDKHFVHAVHRTVQARTSIADSAPTYVYRFNYESTSYSFVKQLFAEKHVPGTCHGDDLPFLFKPAFIGKYPNRNSVEWSTIEHFCNTWVTFAATGNPNNESLGAIKWEPITTPVVDPKTKLPTYKCLNIADEVSLIDLPEADRVRFWDSLYKDVKMPSS